MTGWFAALLLAFHASQIASLPSEGGRTTKDRATNGRTGSMLTSLYVQSRSASAGILLMSREEMYQIHHEATYYFED